jgi:hypothetical protein
VVTANRELATRRNKSENEDDDEYENDNTANREL